MVPCVKHFWVQEGSSRYYPPGERRRPQRGPDPWTVGQKARTPRQVRDQTPRTTALADILTSRDGTDTDRSVTLGRRSCPGPCLGRESGVDDLLSLDAEGVKGLERPLWCLNAWSTFDYGFRGFVSDIRLRPRQYGTGHPLRRLGSRGETPSRYGTEPLRA